MLNKNVLFVCKWIDKELNNLDIELDFDDKVCIFRSGEKLDVKAQDLKDGDRIVSVGSGDISKMLERTKETV